MQLDKHLAIAIRAVRESGAIQRDWLGGVAEGAHKPEPQKGLSVVGYTTEGGQGHP